MSAPAVVGSVNLLDWDDSTTTNVQMPASTFSLEDFRPDIMSPQIFQSKWMSLPDVINGKLCMLQSIPSSPADVEASLRTFKVRSVPNQFNILHDSLFFFLFSFLQIFSIASGVIPGPAGTPAGFKLFLYGIERREPLVTGSEVLYMAQLLVNLTTKEATLTMKVDQPNSKQNDFVDLILKSLAKYYPQL
jgi:hypothetical protein